MHSGRYKNKWLNLYVVYNKRVHMKPEIVKVKGRSRLKEFIDFPEKLYEVCPNWVPPLRGDEFDTFNRKVNGAYDYCDSECFLAYHGKKPVGRIAAIINRKANDVWGCKVVRFGWLDFIEDEDVARALTDAVAEWGRERGCEVIKGPLGFTDMDKEGLLVAGYERLSPFTCLYNYPYYDEILERIGFSKDVDWIQRLIYVDEECPDVFKYASVVEERYDIHPVYPTSIKELSEKYGLEIFHMYNEAFAPLFQFTPLSDRQIERYLKTYVPILSPDFVSIVVNGEGKPVAFAFCVPSLSAAVKKSRGRLFPLGFLRILRALRHNDTLEALMIGVLPEYQAKGATILMFKHIHERCIKRGIKKIILNPQLETNLKVQTLFDGYRAEPYMKRRAYSKNI